MPIEIKELHIKINVNDNEQSNVSQRNNPEGKMDDLIKACVEEVFNIQSRKKER
ncbi:MAG TPA: DUF5908 family protein [Aequorivita sp.]|nr:DUF5908 family protein [Aequorivita sp.]